MASCYVVAYSPRPGIDYSGLTGELKQSLSYWQGLGTTWLILSFESPTQLHHRLAPHLNQTDHLLISKIVPPYAGQLPPEAWDWLQKHVDV